MLNLTFWFVVYGLVCWVVDCVSRFDLRFVLYLLIMITICCFVCGLGA